MIENLTRIPNRVLTLPKFSISFSITLLHLQARRRGGSRGSIEPPLEVNNGGLKTQTVDFQSAFSK